jgi:hypothetical protein
MGTASGMVLPSTLTPVNSRHTGLVSRGLRLLFEEDCVCAVYSPSSMLASGSEALTAGATVSSWGRGADSSAAGVEFLQPPPHWVHLHPRTSLLISCRVHH